MEGHEYDFVTGRLVDAFFSDLNTMNLKIFPNPVRYTSLKDNPINILQREKTLRDVKIYMRQ